MKTQNSIRFALLVAAAMFTQVTFAAGGPKPPAPPPPQPSSGTMVLALPNAISWGLAATPSGTIYTLGNNYSPPIAGGNQLVLGSTDSGSSWFLFDDFAPEGRYVDFFGWAGLGGGITSDPTGILYTSGLSYPDNATRRP